METGFVNKITGFAIALVVGALLVGGLLIPTVQGITDTEKTFENEGYFHLDKMTDDFTFSWDYNEPAKFIVNDKETTYTNTSGLAQSVVLGEKFALRLVNNNTAVNFYGAGTYITADSTNNTMTVAYSSGTVTVTNGVSTKTIANVTEAYTISPDGPYVMKKATDVAYLHSGSEIIADSEIYASGQTYSGNNNIFWHMAGTIENMEYPDTFDTNLTISNEQIHGEASQVCKDVFVLDKITFTATASTQPGVTYNVTASYFVVPAEITAELIHHMDATQIAMFGVISILGIVALVVVAANGIRNKY